MKLLFGYLAVAIAVFGAPGRHFEENLGQAGQHGREVQYLASTGGHRVYFTGREVIWPGSGTGAVRLRFEGSAGNARWQAAGAQTGAISYALGNDRSQWVRGARQFERIAWKGVYPGIDAEFYWNGDRLEYDLIVAPGADPKIVRVVWSGADARLDADGSIHVAGGRMKQLAPAIFQGAEKIAGKFESTDRQGEFRLALGIYDPRRTLVVDPVVEFATYLGGENEDAVAVVADSFVAGTTASVQFPGTVPERRRSRDIFVRGTGTFGSPGTQLIGTLVFGGSRDEDLGGAHYMSGGRSIMLGGTTASDDFPVTTQGASPRNGSTDGFLMQVSANPGQALFPLSALLVGGSGDDRILAVSGGASWYVYGGETTSPDIPRALGQYRGGRDGFLGHSGMPNLYYLGGSADDRILTLGVINYNYLIAGGETHSADFPYLQPGSPGLQGPSDGFLTGITLIAQPTEETPDRFATWLLGGSGEDRVTALTATQGSATTTIASIAFAGSTSSPDLPVAGAVQEALAGEWDAFAGTWRQGAIEMLTYLGGAATEEATAVARNAAGDVFVGGWTRSSDLKTVLPVQERAAGGEDGFYAIMGPGVFRTLTYYGGSGDDRVQGLALLSDGIARLGGRTTSTDLPVKNPWQSARAAGTEGFVVDLGSSYLSAPAQLVVPKDGAAGLRATAAQNAPGLLVTYRSADPEKALISDGVTSAAELTALLGQQVYVEGLAAAGEVDILISAPGFQSALSRARLYPGAMVASLPQTPILTWSSPLSLLPYWAAIDPATDRPIVVPFVPGGGIILRPGVSFPSLNWSSSNERVGTVVTSFSNLSESAQLILNGPGETVIRLQAGTLPVWPPDGGVVTVIRPSMTVPSMRLGKDLQSNLQLTIPRPPGLAQVRGTITARSADPSRLLLSADPAQPGAETVVISPQPFSQQFPPIWAQALSGEGDVEVYLSSPDFNEEVAMTVHLEPAGLRWGRRPPGISSQQLLTAFSLPAGLEDQLVFQFESASGILASGRRPGAPELVLELKNSADTVLEVNRANIRPAVEATRLRGLATGSATLAISVPPGSDLALINGEVQVEVTAAPASSAFVAPASAMDVGQDLQARVTFRYTRGPAAITVVSEDPSALLVSSAAAQTGRQTLALGGPSSGDEYLFFVQALRGTGESFVTIRYPEGEYRIRVTLTASGVGLRSTFADAGFDQGFEVETYRIDELTGTPIAPQFPVPGKSFEVSLRTTGAPVRLSKERVVLNSDSSTANISATLPPFGEEAVLIAESAGVAVRQPLRRGTQRFQVSGLFTLAQDTVRALQISASIGVSNPAVKLKATSSDPESLLLSMSAGTPGSASIDWNRDSTFQTIYVQGMKSTGQATVTLTGDGFEPFSVLITLIPLRPEVILGSFIVPSSMTLPAGQVQTGSIRAPGAGFRPGAAPLRLGLRTGDPAVAEVSPAQIEISAAASSRPFTLTPKLAGSTEFIVETDRAPGTPAARSNVNVRNPSGTPVMTEELALGANLQIAVSLQLGQQNPNGVIASIVSSEPGLLVVSRSQSALGSGTTSVAIQAGLDRGTVYLQALAPEGEATVTATVPGFPERRWRVRLTRSWFTPRPASFSTPISLGETGTIAVGVEQEGESGQNLQLRPGLGPLRLEISAGTPGLLDLVTASVTIPDSADTQDATFQVRGVAEGSTLVRFEQPSGFGPPPAGRGQMPVRVVPRTMLFICGREGTIAIGRDTQTMCYFSRVPAGVRVEAVSADPTKLLLSADAMTVGSGRQTFTAAVDNQLILQGLASSGTVEVTLTAPGFQPARVSVVLQQPEVYFPFGVFSMPQGETRNVTLILAVRGPGSSSPDTVMARAGSAIRVEVGATPAGIVSFDPTVVTFAGGGKLPSPSIRGVARGSAILTVSTPEGFKPSTQPSPVVAVQ